MSKSNETASFLGKVLLAVSGGIAAYKSVEICSQLIKKGYQVKVMMTESAQEFVTPLTFETVTQNPVATDLFSKASGFDVEHISWAKWADLVLVCPATANVLGKVANGICDDFVSTTLMASQADLMLAPAMNTAMYNHPANKRNLAQLEQDGHLIIEPQSGRLACGDEGKGRLADIEIILEEVEDYFEGITKDTSLKGYTALVTAGATKESIDPVRYISNPSTGRMGVALAKVLQKKGAHVILIAASTAVDLPQDTEIMQVTSSEDMYKQVMNNLDRADIVVKAAAVSDYTPSDPQKTKMKKNEQETDKYELSLEKTRDILQEIGSDKGDKVIVGFAAETDNINEKAINKLKKKNVDLLVVNDITAHNAGFSKDVNTVNLYYSNGSSKALPTMSKKKLGDELTREIQRLLF